MKMAEISASSVMQLRKMSGQGMMDCKKALQEAEGNIDKAMEILRKKGLATMAKRAERQTSEGVVVGSVSDDGTTGILTSLCCETDFVAKSEDFLKIADSLGKYAMAAEAIEGAQSILETVVAGKNFSEVLTELVSKTGEKTEVGDFAKFKLEGVGFITIYIHFNKKVATMIEFETDSDSVAKSEKMRQAANDIAMHITAVNPLALSKDMIDEETITKERAIYAEQVKNKPAAIIDKIVDGKLNKFFAEKCLLSQPFVKDDSKTVAQVVDDTAKEAGGKASIKRFVRLSVA
jgi:elongation factor Ts